MKHLNTNYIKLSNIWQKTISTSQHFMKKTARDTLKRIEQKKLMPKTLKTIPQNMKPRAS